MPDPQRCCNDVRNDPGAWRVMAFLKSGEPYQKRKSLRALGLTHGQAGKVPASQATSVYGQFPESGCLGGGRFCKFTFVGRPDG
jgi:hypothetical protein